MAENPPGALISLLFCRDLDNGVGCHRFGNYLWQSKLLACVSHSVYLPDLGRAHLHLTRTSMLPPGWPGYRVWYPILIFPGSIPWLYSLLNLVFPVIESHFSGPSSFEGQDCLTMLAGSLCMPVPRGWLWSLHLRCVMPGPSSVYLVPADLFFPSCFSQNLIC